MSKPFGIFHKSILGLDELVDVCNCGHTHDTHKYFDIFCFRFLLGTTCYYCKCKKYEFKTKMTLREAVDKIDLLPQSSEVF